MLPVSFAGATKDLGCLHDVLRPAGATPVAYADEYFIQRGATPSGVGEALATYHSATSAYTSIVDTLRSPHCRHQFPGNPNQMISIELRPSTKNPFGKDSATFTADVQALGTPNIVATILVAVVGRYVVEVVGVSAPPMGSISAKDLATYETQALARLR